MLDFGCWIIGLRCKATPFFLKSRLQIPPTIPASPSLLKEKLAEKKSFASIFLLRTPFLVIFAPNDDFQSTLDPPNPDFTSKNTVKPGFAYVTNFRDWSIHRASTAKERTEATLRAPW